MKMRTLNEAAAELGTTRMKLRAAVLAGTIPHLKWGNRYLVDVDVVGPMLRECEPGADGTLSLIECAEQIGLAPDALRRMALAGLVPYRRSGRYYRFVLADVQAAIRKEMTTD